MKSFITILFSFFAIAAFSQKVDTVEFRYSKYSYAKTEEARKYNYKVIVYKLGFNAWSIDGKDSIMTNVFEEVSKQEYDAFIDDEKKFGNCSMCWQRHYDVNGVLKREGLYNTDCPIGETRTYNNKTGKLKTIFFWRKLTENEKLIFKLKCSVKTGEWIYFKPDGSKEKIEKYKDNVLIETIQF